MSQVNPRALFLGDLEDPWVQDLARALPPWVPCFSNSGDTWPDAWPSEVKKPEIVILQRSALIEPDRDQLARLRASAADALTLVLVVGDHVRYQIRQRWLVEVDAILPDATAKDVIGRWVEVKSSRRLRAVRPALVVVSQQFETREVLARSCEALGYSCKAIAERPNDIDVSESGSCLLWDVPLLDSGWAKELEQATRSRTVIALLGFANRETVRLARSKGAAACLELPYDLADLAFVLDRIVHDPGPHFKDWRLEPGRNHTTPDRHHACGQSLASRQSEWSK